jgi:hypothetical protein
MIGDIIEIQRAKYALGDVHAVTISTAAEAGVMATSESSVVERPALLGARLLQPLRAVLSLTWRRALACDSSRESPGRGATGVSVQARDQ